MASRFARLFDRFANATATIEQYQEIGTVEDEYGDPVPERDWVAIAEDVPARYVERDADSIGTEEFTGTKHGDVTSPYPLLYIPGDEAAGADGGERVTIAFQDAEIIHRIRSADHRTLDMGDTGYRKFELADFGDQEVD